MNEIVLLKLRLLLKPRLLLKTSLLLKTKRSELRNCRHGVTAENRLLELSVSTPPTYRVDEVLPYCTLTVS